MNERMHTCMHGWTDGQMDAWTDGRMDDCVCRGVLVVIMRRNAYIHALVHSTGDIPSSMSLHMHVFVDVHAISVAHT